MLLKIDGKITKKLIVVSTCIAVVIFIITAVFLCDVNKDTLVLFNGKTGEVYRKWDVYPGLQFSVEFIHSVNKSPVTDVFEIRDKTIFVDKTIYSAFGAGVQTEVEQGQTLSYDADGNMVVSGFDIEFPQVKYIVGTVSDHVLCIEEESISLRELCGRNTHVVFELR